MLDLSGSTLPYLNLTIPMQSISTNKKTKKKDLDAMNENIYPYPDLDEIQEIKIKDEDYKISENILIKFDDSKYNKCKNCKVNANSVFCMSCRHNYCDKCSRGCKNDPLHTLIDLAKMKEESKKYISEIQYLFSKYFILQKNETKNPNEKKEVNYDISIVEENPLNGPLNIPDTNDIQLIDKICRSKLIFQEI